MKGSVYQRGSKCYYKFRVPQRDPSTDRYPRITTGGYDWSTTTEETDR